MEHLILEIKNYIYDTFLLCKNYLISFDLKVLGALIVIFYLVFLRKWELKKILTFSLTVILFFVILVRAETFLQQSFGAEGSDIGIGVARIIFFILIAVVYIYHVAVKN